jgi:hypothetical protein
MRLTSARSFLNLVKTADRSILRTRKNQMFCVELMLEYFKILGLCQGHFEEPSAVWPFKIC